MEITFAVFAILPLTLLWWQPKGERRGITGILPLLTALLPVAASAVQSMITRRSGETTAQQQARQAQRADLDRQKAEYYQENYSPQAQQNQAMATMQLGRLAGAMGGLDRVPPALRNLLSQRRTARPSEYNTNVPNAPRAGGLGLAQDLIGAAGSFDVAGYNRARQEQRQQQQRIQTAQQYIA